MLVVAFSNFNYRTYCVFAFSLAKPHRFRGVSDGVRLRTFCQGNTLRKSSCVCFTWNYIHDVRSTAICLVFPLSFPVFCIIAALVVVAP